MQLADKTVVVTGCNRGIGRAILENICLEGARKVFCVVRKKTDIFIEVCEKLSEEYDTAIEVVEADFSSNEEVKLAAKAILANDREIDVLINNVGIYNPLTLMVMTKMDTIEQSFQVNLFSSIQLTQYIAKAMMKNKRGSIVFISSSASFDGGGNIEYSASKAAINGAVKSLARELGEFGIRVNAVAPGVTQTDMSDKMSDSEIEVAKQRNIMHRVGDSKEIANAVIFMASDKASFITGQILRVDGGLL